MYVVTVIALLLTAWPGVQGTCHAIAQLPQERSWGSVVGLAVITIAGSGSLLALLFTDNLF